jgi:hypothetical protein
LNGVAGGSDLTGRWKGIFNYPRLLPPTEFDAELRDLAGSICGVTSEPHVDGNGLILHATLEGFREGARVRFKKVYDDPDDEYRPVLYEGDVDSSGDEILGKWTVPGAWSGSFIMVRHSGKEEAEVRRVSEEVGP